MLLTFRVNRKRRVAFFRFVRRAFPFYERPGGIHMSLYEDKERPGTFVEIASYDTKAAFDQDQERVRSDPQTLKVLSEWRSLLSGPPEVRLVLRSRGERRT